MRRFISSLVIATFCAAATPAFAQFGAIKEGAKKAGTATKEAGKATVDTTKKAVKATEKGTKKAAGATKDATQESYVCVDGSTDKAVFGSKACKGHGGVRAEAPKHGRARVERHRR